MREAAQVLGVEVGQAGLEHLPLLGQTLVADGHFHLMGGDKF